MKHKNVIEKTTNYENNTGEIFKTYSEIILEEMGEALNKSPPSSYMRNTVNEFGKTVHTSDITAS